MINKNINEKTERQIKIFTIATQVIYLLGLINLFIKINL
jgi:hypothetical protein